MYFELVKPYSPSLSVNHKLVKKFKQMLLIGSTTIRLFSEVLKGVGRNRKSDGKKKGGAKVHMVIDAHQQIGRFISITAARVHDKKFLEMYEAKAHILLVYDRAYNHYQQFAKWTKAQVYFITRKKSNAKYKVIEVLDDKKLEGKAHGVRLDQIIELQYKDEKEIKPLQIRRVTYYDEDKESKIL